MNPASENKKITLISVGILVVLALAAFVCWASFQPQALEPVKEITITVTHSDAFIAEDNEAEPFELTIETTAKTLVDAFADRHELLFVYGQEGMVLSIADREMADFHHNQYWLCYLDGEVMEDPFDVHEIEDGNAYYLYLASEE